MWSRCWTGSAAAGLLIGFLAATAPMGAAPAQADPARITLVEENDGLLPDKWDRHYTQGAVLTYLSPTLRPEDFANRFFDAVASHLPIFQTEPGILRKYDIVVGQSIFTPTDYHRLDPDPLDRPFAGYLYTGGALLQETGGTMLESLELLAGIVGPDSLAQDAQEGFHAAAGFNNANLDQAWSHQLRDEPGFMLSYDRHWKIWQAAFHGVEMDVIPDAGFTAGNVMTYAEAGGQVRIGQNLGVDYGAPRVRPGLSGANWFNGDRLTGPFGWYLFAGVQGRAVAQNIFLDGNSFRDSPHVDKKVFVGDASGGLSIFWKDWVKLDFSATIRSKEFNTQAEADHFATAALSFRF